MVKTIWKQYTARDFSPLQYISFEKQGAEERAIILIHGITAELHHQKQFAEALQKDAHVYLPVLRGYDQLNSRGDLSYMEQFDDDLFDFIHFVRKKGYREIVLAGHSMGCANVLRLMNKNSGAADRYLFISPFFHPYLPVYREDATDQSKSSTDVDYEVYHKKTTALMIFYKFGIKRFLHWRVARIPDEFNDSGELFLSFRLMVSRFLEEVPEDIMEGLDERVRAYIGENDEVIQPDRLMDWYKQTFQKDIQLIPETDHNHILHDATFHESLGKWLKNS